MNASATNFFIKSGYKARAREHYFDDRPFAQSDIIYQPDVYALASFIASRYGADTIVDIGCGSARKLMELDGFRKIGVDFGINLEHCRASFPGETWLSADLETATTLPIDDTTINHSVIVCADVIEHLVDPTALLVLLRRLAHRACAIIITTPDRELLRGEADQGPPANPSHVREWTSAELRSLLDVHALSPTFIGLTVNNNKALEKKTIIAVVDGAAGKVSPVAVDDFRPLAIVASYNEVDIALETIGYLLNDGFDVHVLDNWSTDGGFEALSALKDRHGSLSVDRFPPDGSPAYYEWNAILQKKEEIARQYPGRWIVHADCDEIHASPWASVSFRQGLWVADRMGFSAVDFTVCDFRPVDDAFGPGAGLEKTLTQFEFGKRPGHFKQIKAWKQPAQPVALAKSGGHEAAFPGRRVFPYKFLLKHYPLRNSEQARRKVFQERLPRFSPQERARGWHIHYDDLKPDDSFRWQHGLIEFDERNTRRDYLVELLSGVGIVR